MKTALLGAGFATAASWAYIRNLQLPAGPSRLSWGAQVFGHRGCRHVAGIPENTLEALEFARSNGARGIEIDIRLTRDNQLVVFHDAFTGHAISNRDPKTRIDQLDLVDVKSLVYETDKSAQVRVPTLEETILYCRDSKLKMLIEIKEFQRPRLAAEKLLEMYNRYPDFMYTETIVIGFSPYALYQVRKRDRKVAVGMIHSGTVLQGTIMHKIDETPLYVRLFPRLLDRILEFGQTKIAPWVIGVSTMCPRFNLYTDEYKRLWLKRGISVYIWGFENPQQCPENMRTEGVTVAVDDAYLEYYPARKEPTYQSVFPDAPSNNQQQISS